MKLLLTLSFLTVAAVASAQQPTAAERSFAHLCGAGTELMSAARPTLIDGHDYGWQDWGQGEIYDGWLTCIWRDDDGNRVDPTKYVLTCMFQRSTTPEGYIRIAEPWRSATGWFSQFHEGLKENRDLIIDMTDPRLIIIMPQFTGITAIHPISKTPIEYIVHNFEGYSLFFYDDPDGAVEINEKCPDLVTTFENHEIHIAAPMWSLVNLGDEIDEDDLGGCNAPETVIYMPDWQGVSDAEISTEEGTPEYYTLQGMRVAEPSSGCYIRRTGSRAEKVYIR